MLLKICSVIHLHTFFLILDKLSEHSCTQWLKHATVEHRLNKTVLQTELLVAFYMH